MNKEGALNSFPAETRQGSYRKPIITMHIERGANKAFLFWNNNFSLVASTAEMDLRKA